MGDESEPDADEIGRGILVEIWGYAYLADAKGPMDTETVGQNSNGGKKANSGPPEKS